MTVYHQGSSFCPNVRLTPVFDAIDELQKLFKGRIELSNLHEKHS